jgi:hypothetical protein
MGFHINDSMVRVDLFKPSGKWSESFAIDMGEFYNELLIHDAVTKAWLKTREIQDPLHWKEWTLVCLEPYHKHSHPVIIRF